jgi:hypothetical protein
MSLELISTLAAVGTFVVIATTAVAALVQLRHLQSSNQLQAMLSINEKWDSPEMSRAVHYVRTELPAKLAQADYAASLLAHRHDLELHREMLVCDVWEQVGSLVKYGLIRREPLLDLACSAISDQWDALSLTIAILRQTGGPGLFENFEYLAVLSRQWIREHPDGVYPTSVERLTLPSLPATRRTAPS